MRRMMSMLSAAVVLLVGFGVAGPSGAATARAETANCPGATAYPLVPAAMVQVSATAPQVGATISVSGAGFCADEDVTVTYDGTQTARAHTNARGAFDSRVRITGPAGTKAVCADGASGLRADRDCVDVSARGENATPDRDETTAFTGSNLWLLIAVAAALVVAGGGMVAAGRRRASRT